MVLKYERDHFTGIIISSRNLPEASVFTREIRALAPQFIEEGLSLVWLYLPLERADLVAPAVAEGFIYHHTDSQGLQMVFPLVPGSFIPGYATHYIGAGGVLLDAEDRILVIQERFHIHKHYKLPGGALNPGEHIAAAVVREVKEETGIESEFMGMCAFRHWHGYRFGKSDIYFICRLRPLSFEITMDPQEISEACWMPLEDFYSHPDTHIFNKRAVRAALEKPGFKPEIIEGYKSPESHEIFF